MALEGRVCVCVFGRGGTAVPPPEKFPGWGGCVSDPLIPGRQVGRGASPVSVVAVAQKATTGRWLPPPFQDEFHRSGLGYLCVFMKGDQNCEMEPRFVCFYLPFPSSDLPRWWSLFPLIRGTHQRHPGRKFRLRLCLKATLWPVGQSPGG